ncbi:MULTISPECIES: helix-turn-helix domain-containing protein [unclassified Pseudomonas]|uniref:helix-turn-helix domain-containing protein n=1 Tax=unclassified Pseudomonas TaxID=196821 RepID=UPI000FDEEA7A|nr:MULTISPECIES: helix-turn-helix domain-containing protein [unclassified Pseudomonas]AZZ76268.1 AraC family transcriptional regulator [Pseudomonas sp. RU47]WNZ87053.1 helix-turn-helix domain-containing protein [Pseudomonas sp. P108]
MATTVRTSQAPTSSQDLRITGESMREYLPGDAQTFTPRLEIKDVVIQLFTHRSVIEPILVPAVVEPLLVLVLAGAARVEERLPGGAWEAAEVSAGDFFLTSSDEPYEMRWQTYGGDTFEVMHLYLGLPLIEQASRELLGEHAGAVRFRDVSGARDGRVAYVMEQLRTELVGERLPSALFVRSLAQALAVHLVRSYRAETRPGRRVNALQAYKLRKVTDAMSADLAAEFSLAKLARLAELSEYHFSRLFKRATGLSPSQYFIRLRMVRARHLLLETRLSVIEIGLEVGYSSPSHFSQVFRREAGVTPSDFRGA